MELERATELPHTHNDRSQRKRAIRRRRRDVPAPANDKAHIGLCGEQGNENVTHSKAISENISLPAEGVGRNGSWRRDDKDGHFSFELGENLTSRYKINRKMGEGLSGQVLECWDRENKEMVAIKIVRSIKKFREGAKFEISVLKLLGKRDGSRCVQLKHWFDYQNHICIVFEKLGPSLLEFLWKNCSRSFSIDLVREIGRQLLESIATIHDLRLVHTDLKPDNILLVSSDYVKVPDYRGFWRFLKDGSYYKRIPKSSAIKVIDFGSTDVDGRDPTCVVTSQPYRAPEVILGLGWSSPCDIWSAGCILVELCSREILFWTQDNLAHLAMMERLLGPLPQHMLEDYVRRDGKYVRSGRLDWPEGAASQNHVKSVMKLPRLQNLIKQHVDHSAGDFIHLLQGLLKYDPRDRLTAREALRHPFFTRKRVIVNRSFSRKTPASYFVKIKKLLAVSLSVLILYLLIRFHH